ncbi:hypothetical protein EVAR_36849_1 [Eumeta japonica]|uniref:Uncharacterized protein n=1 Tax=Eumeta variegata TaxID=151549 RepID=A0A4C1WE60_EUMVA|nr:hypothetical protein EVAR_36849_1 [Eumeta japonica]
MNLTDDLRKGRRSTPTTEDDISAVRRMTEPDKRVTYQQIWTSLSSVCFFFLNNVRATSPMDTGYLKGVTNMLPDMLFDKNGIWEGRTKGG